MSSRAAGPVVLVVDDLHWADRPSVRALVFAVRRLVADQVLVVLATRDDAGTELPESLRRVVSGHHGDVVRLTGLDEGDLRELAERLGIAALPARAARRLRDGTRGNPLHVRAVLDESPVSTTSPGSTRFRTGGGTSGGRSRRRGRSACWSATATRRVPTTPAGSSTPPPSWACARRCRSRRASARSANRCRPSTRPWPAACWSRRPRRTRGRWPSRTRWCAPPSTTPSGLPGARALHLAAAALVEGEVAVLHHRVAAAPALDGALADDLEAFARRAAAGQQWQSATRHLVESARLCPDRDEGRRRLLVALSWMLQAGDAASAAAFTDELRALPAGPLRDSVLGTLAMARDDPAGAEEMYDSAWKQCGGIRSGGDGDVAATIALQSAVHHFGRLEGAATVDWSRRAVDLAGPESPVGRRARTYLAHGLAYSGRTAEAFAALDGAQGDATDPEVAWLQPRSARGLLRMVEDDLDGARADFHAVATRAYELGVLNIAAFAFAYLARAEYLAGAWDDAVAARRARRGRERRVGLGLHLVDGRRHRRSRARRAGGVGGGGGGPGRRRGPVSGGLRAVGRGGGDEPGPPRRGPRRAPRTWSPPSRRCGRSPSATRSTSPGSGRGRTCAPRGWSASAGSRRPTRCWHRTRSGPPSGAGSRRSRASRGRAGGWRPPRAGPTAPRRPSSGPSTRPAGCGCRSSGPRSSWRRAASCAARAVVAGRWSCSPSAAAAFERLGAAPYAARCHVELAGSGLHPAPRGRRVVAHLAGARRRAAGRGRPDEPGDRR